MLELNRHVLRLLALATATTLLAGCATRAPTRGGSTYGSYDQAPTYREPAYPSPSYRNGAVVGYVRHIEVIDARANTSGSGALIGGVVGAVVGRQFGGPGRGRAQGTAVGAIGGALIGNEIEKDRSGGRDGVRVHVDLAGGGQRSFDFDSHGGLRVGDRVRIEGDRLLRD